MIDKKGKLRGRGKKIKKQKTKEEPKKWKEGSEIGTGVPTAL